LTGTTVHELAAALRGRYLRGSKQEKGRLLDQFCQITGYRRKSAVRLLRHPPKARSKHGGRPKEYGAELAESLKTAWEATDRICSKRLAPFLPELVPILERGHAVHWSGGIRAQLLQLSPGTIDRLLAPFRRCGGRRGLSTTRSVSALKKLIPIRPCADRKHAVVGHVEVDLAAHCGANGEGFFLNTLVAVDVATGWTECIPVWGKGQGRVGSAIHQLRSQLPFPMLGLHSDNGSEFINHRLWQYCQQHGIEFTRSRSYKKNDQAHVGQKNWSTVRRLVGYDRYCTKAAYHQLEYLYPLVRLHSNFFQPICKLIGRERDGAKVHKQYDRAQTPYQRLLASDRLSKAERNRLALLYQALNPLQLRTQIDDALHTLWQMAQPDPRTGEETAALAQLQAASNPRQLW
jgi:hypothetical protein